MPFCFPSWNNLLLHSKFHLSVHYKAICFVIVIAIVILILRMFLLLFLDVAAVALGG